MTTTPTDDLPPLPEPDMWIPHSITELSASYTADQMRAYALADRQARAAQAEPPLTESERAASPQHGGRIMTLRECMEAEEAAPHPEQQSTVQPVALNDRDAVRRWVKSVPAWRDPFTLDSLIVVLKAWEALRVTAPFQPKANPVAPREDALHNAVCNAVSIMNQSIDIARSADGRKAKDVLRQALIDYADWSSK